MPTHILPALDRNGKRMPMCHYPDTMHDFQPMPLDPGGSHVAACRRCGARLTEIPAAEAPIGRPDPSERVVRDRARPWPE